MADLATAQENSVTAPVQAPAASAPVASPAPESPSHTAGPAEAPVGAAVAASSNEPPKEATAPLPTVKKRMGAREMLDELDLHAAMWAESQKETGDATCRRSRERRPFRTSCDIWQLDRATGLVRRQSGFTRNLSERGIGLLAKTAILKSTPLEVRIEAPGRRPVYLGGIVMWCRYASDDFHEVGVELKARQERPIFSMDGGQAAKTTPWLAEALQQPPPSEPSDADECPADSK